MQYDFYSSYCFYSGEKFEKVLLRTYFIASLSLKSAIEYVIIILSFNTIIKVNDFLVTLSY